MRSRRRFLPAAALLLFFALALPAGADTPRVMHYQGTLADTSGSLPTGVYDLTFRLYGDSSAAGPVLWEEPRTGVEVEDGLFQVILGRTVAIPDSVIAMNDLWLGLTVGMDPELAPRRPMGSAFFAMRAGTADDAAVAAAAAFAESAGVAGAFPAHDHDDLYFTETELSGAGTINDPSNPVDWTKLKNVPAGFADGTDDEGASVDDGDWTVSGDDLYAAVPGKVGIGTTTPEFKLSLGGDGGILATGTFDAGDTLQTAGAGSRLLWYPRKAAFRAGHAGGNHWDDANIGIYTIGLGRNTRATGQASAALGWGTTTTGTASFAAGSGITAAGAFSAVLGRSSAARGTGNVAIGSFLRAGPAENAMAIGSGIDAADSLVNDIENSLVVGFGDTTAALFVGGPENRVGVRTTAPAADLDVAGKVRADSLQIPTGAEDGYVLTSDASGNAAWQPGGVESDGDWTVIEQIGPDNLIANVDGHVGIGADYPRMKLSLAGDGGILAKGELYEGVRLDSGRTGPEMLWYPRKAAFRAGEVSSSHDWTHDNMGYWSTAFGDAVRASGDGSVAIGLNLHSSGENAFTIGSGLGIQLERRLTNDIDNSFLIGFGDTTATFFVGGPDGRVGVKTTAPAADLDVAGTVRTEAFHMPTGAADGYVLTSDAAGEASWASPAVLSDGDWTVNGSNMSSNVAGNVGVGTSSPGYKLDVNGTMRVSNPGGANTTLVLRDSNGSSDRPGIRFENNSLHYITGDDASDEVFYFAGKNSNARSYDAILRVMGSASDSWGTYTEITHDGTDGHVVTDTGDLYLEPEGDVRIGAAANPTDLVVSGVVNTDSLYRIKSEPFLEVRDSDCLLIGGAIGGAGSDNCVAIGEDAKGFGSENTSVGYNAGCSHAGWEIGNTCVGSNANGKGNYNTYVGADVGTKEGGDRNVFIGVGVRPDDGPGDSSSDNVIIGYKAGRFLSNVNNKLLIANDSTANDILIYGDFEEHKVGIGPQTDLLGTLTLNGYWGNSVVFNTGSHWYMGVDDSNDDKFSVGTGSTLGQNVRLSLDENGMAHFSGRPDGDDSSYVTLNDNGVALRAQSVDSIAVRVFSDNSYGLRSITQEQEALVGYSTNDRALFTHSDNSLAAFFDGDVMIAGWISKASGSFLIDHPLDPENKLLRHNFVESPENLLVYRGTVTLGGDGEGTVTMPDYFEALAKETEATVNLSTVGKPFLTGYEWNADHVSFTVYGDPGREVGWMVMADRDDPVMRRFARPVEERKTADSKICPPGRLLYPEAYGYPESKSSEYEERRALREGR